MIAICNGSEVVYLLSDAADLSAWPLVVDGANKFINGIAFERSAIEGVDLPEGTKPNGCELVGGVVQIRARVANDLAQARLDRWELIKIERERRLLTGGYPTGGHWFHSDYIARSQHLANARKADRVEAAAGDMSATLTNALGGPVVVKSMDNGYMPVSATLAHAIMDAAEVQEMATYAAAIAHKTAMEAAPSPAAYNYLSSGWPAIFVP